MRPPLSLYLHLPWCVRKCPYCDFNSHAIRPQRPGAAAPEFSGLAAAQRRRYVDALCRDLELEAPSADGRGVLSVFLGGGTPSLFSGADIARLLAAVRRGFALSDDAEITLEANPGTVERHGLAGYRQAGVNRLSLGAQSFDAGSLERLGRIHGPGDTAAALAGAREAGFDNVNLDLMFALPGQTLAMAGDDVAVALELGPEHLSLYQLTLEPNTVFYRRPPADLPDDELAARMQEQAFRALAAAGFARYEVSAFARPGRACRHNLNYWRFGDYLAVGAGAHGKITDRRGRVQRYRKPLNPGAYMARLEGQAAAREPAREPAREDSRRIAGEELVFEFMLNALRLTAGFAEADFEARTGLSAAGLRPALESLAARGLLEAGAGGRWRPSPLGLRFLNDLQAEFLPAPTAAA